MQISKRRLPESTVIFQILWGISSHVKYKIYSYLNKLIVSQSNVWLILEIMYYTSLCFDLISVPH